MRDIAFTLGPLTWPKANLNAEHQPLSTTFPDKSKPDPGPPPTPGSFLYEKSTPEALFYQELMEEHRVKEKVKSVSSGIDIALPALSPFGQPPASNPALLLGLSSLASIPIPPAPVPTPAPASAPAAGKRNRWGPAPPETTPAVSSASDSYGARGSSHGPIP